ncbi:hypothetical protein WL80_28805 [Burkholderia ubonensis]|nr:hypothetical protein WI75_27325 [Burkholderia ubonensis]KVL62272.1 hypothetical protein WJ48_25270 [Burkholderia ubonensis]KWF02147.1 hypothetical protein WL80_28805 [Burkholderia ubonensis]
MYPVRKVIIRAPQDRNAFDIAAVDEQFQVASDLFFDCSVFPRKAVVFFPRKVICPLRRIRNLGKHVPSFLDVRQLLTEKIPIAFHVFALFLSLVVERVPYSDGGQVWLD